MFVGLLIMELYSEFNEEFELWIVVGILFIYFGFGSMFV